MNNPLNDAILAVLAEHPQGLSEFALLQALAGHPFLEPWAGAGELALFRRHFALMNGLYQLRQQLWGEGWALAVSALHIQLQPLAAEGPALVPQDPLADYYLDWQQLESTGQAEVESLLAAFWRCYAGLEGRQQALAVLGLEADADWRMIKARYRALAARHHPDKGGDSSDFIRIRRAFEQLAGRR
ncbi:DNA-J related domain-containing protein [Gallaecimonas kandeliae]|uniref:DNA-J related domain-containing protein n=1 Tax=Gallaecimonas kandeliae TaxID=3029055 RepID=UPI00264A3CDA|nr:DNA-J related domain-containing protein [Gallaecimonas kandeliae]WKE64060.1 DNA-J related domain-containing protein [Gallaecimonas kandeliae]